MQDLSLQGHTIGAPHHHRRRALDDLDGSDKQCAASTNLNDVVHHGNAEQHDPVVNLVDEIPDRSDDACAPVWGSVRARLQRGDHLGRGSCCADGGAKQAGDRHQHPVRTPADPQHVIESDFRQAMPRSLPRVDTTNKLIKGGAEPTRPGSIVPTVPRNCSTPRTRTPDDRWIHHGRRFAPPIFARRVSCT